MRHSSIVLGWLALAICVSCGDSSGPAPATGPEMPTAQAPPAPSAPPAPAPAPPPAPSPTPPAPSGPRTLRRASFESANGYVTEGSAHIEVTDGDHALVLESDFRTSNSAALDVRLCTNPDCTGASENLGELQRFAGEQRYELPDAGNAYSHVTIYCVAVRLPFGFGRLR